MLRFLPWSLRKLVLDHVPLSVYQRVVRRDLLSLCYHVVSDRRPPHVKHLFEFKTPAAFELDLAYLASHHTLLRYDQARAIRLGEATASPNPFLITFDDGYAECFTTVRQALLKHRVPCVFFITTDFLDNQVMFCRNKVSLCVDRILRMSDEAFAEFGAALGRCFDVEAATREKIVAWTLRLDFADLATIDALCDLAQVDVAAYLVERRPYLTTDQVRQLAADGHKIGAHGASHIRLQSLKDPVKIEREIVSSCRRIQDIVGDDHVPFAFPYGGDGIDRALLADIRRRHDVVDLFCDTYELCRDHAFVVNRICGDPPGGAPLGESNLPVLLRHLYRLAV
jgi:peptidoglycan/xylan/chitin deacetylase (PgdA/CDA1 family)